jgi:acyl dehydratase
MLVRAALPAIPVVNQVPGVRKKRGPFAPLVRELKGVRIERAAVDAYAAVCGFPRKDTVPLPYPHMLAFPLHMSIMSDPGFPWPAIGMVHTENSITAYRPVHVGDIVDVTVRVGAPRAHEKGALVDFVTVVQIDEDVVWEETSTYLRLGKTVEGEPAPGLALPPAPEGNLTWRLGADLGRRYAAVSGDHNPIHLYPLTAKALGFPRQIAHGMWSMARCVAALENRLPDHVTVEVAFKKPILLPATVTFGHTETADGHAFGLTRPKDGAPHLVGRITTS